MRAGAVAGAIVGGLIAVLAVMMMVVGGGAFIGYAAAGEDGFLESPTQRFASEAYAVTFEDVDLHVDRPDENFAVPDFGLDIRVTAESTGEQGLFVGIADVDDAQAYLGEVARDVLVDIDSRGTPTYEARQGGAPATPPAEQDFWEVSAQGTGEIVLDWEATTGDWVGVLMNADGSAGVVADARAGVDAVILLPIGIGLLIGGLVLLAFAGLLIFLATRSSEQAIPTVPPAPPAKADWPPYPVRVQAVLDEPLSRGLWLVKWFLAIPHFIVLAFLWVGFFFATVVAGLSILFTGEYPRALFDFNVGVLRWTWRVTYYAYTLGTDRYPPFSLSDEDYPAKLDVAYPQQLSRGLVLVKWWLLVIPHGIIIGIFTGGAIAASGGQQVATIGLLGALVLIAAVALLFTGRYPQGIFDLVVGLNRWIYRVTAYAALMRDEYPPFRLDMGGSEPPLAPPTPPSQPPVGEQANPPLTPAG